MRLPDRRTLLQGAFVAMAMTLAPVAQAADPVKLTFLLVNDIYKMNEDGGHGGLPRLATIVKDERAKSPNVIFAHGGDTISPSLMSGFDQGAHMIALFNKIPPDVLTPGNHEFDFGPAVFQKRMSEANFPWLAANVRNADGSPVPLLKDTMILERGGIKIGIVGSSLDTTPALSQSGDLKFAPTLATVTAATKALKAQGADIVVAVVHADKQTGQRLMAARAADIILSGHNHDLHIDFDGQTALVESGEDADYVVATDIAVTIKGEGASRQVSWWPNYRIFDTKDVKPDPDMLAAVKVYEAELSKELDVVLGTLTEPLDSRTATVRGGEAAIGNLLADAMRVQSGADIAITNGGGIRAGKEYPVGYKFTRRDVLSELPFGNKTGVTQVSGKAVKAALENGLSQIENRAGRFPQVSGIKVKANFAAPVGSRVLSVEFNGAPIDDNKIYKVATNDFMLRGGDGYSALAPPDASVDSGDRLLANDLMVYARKLGDINVKIEGRIVNTK